MKFITYRITLLNACGLLVIYALNESLFSAFFVGALVMFAIEITTFNYYDLKINYKKTMFSTLLFGGVIYGVLGSFIYKDSSYQIVTVQDINQFSYNDNNYTIYKFDAYINIVRKADATHILDGVEYEIYKLYDIKHKTRHFVKFPKNKIYASYTSHVHKELHRYDLTHFYKIDTSDVAKRMIISLQRKNHKPLDNKAQVFIPHTITDWRWVRYVFYTSLLIMNITWLRDSIEYNKLISNA